MSDKPPGALDTEIASALAAERQVPDVSPQLVETMWASAAARLAETGATGLPLSTAASLTKTIIWSSAFFLLGAIAGVGFDRLFLKPAHPPERMVALPKIRAVDVPRDQRPRRSLAPPSSASTIEAPAPTDAGQRRSRLSSLEREREILDVARAALAAGNARQAREALKRHGRRFPRGRLVEERESLVIGTLVQLGQRAAAEQRARSFLQAFPSSIFAPQVRRVLAELSD